MSSLSRSSTAFPIHRSVPLLFFAFVLLGLLSARLSAASEEEVVTSFSPSFGDSGASITIEGPGVPADPEAHIAFVRDDLSGLGALIEIQTASATSLGGVLGVSPSPFLGELTLWTGVRYELPGGLYQGVGATYLVERATWFVAESTTGTLGFFDATEGCEAAVGSSYGSGKIVIDFNDLPPARIDSGIDLDILVDGGSTSGGGPVGGGGSDSIGRILRAGIRWLEVQDRSPAVLAADLAEVLQSTYGAVGIRASAVGTQLWIEWRGVGESKGGFAVAWLHETP